MTAQKQPAKTAAYTDAQLKKGRAARLEGKSWTKVAKAAGVKSEAYFSRVLRERFPELANAAPAPAKATAKPTARKPARKTAAKK